MQNMHNLVSRLALSPNRPNWASIGAPITLVYHRVHPKWFLRIWCIRQKPCTYLASKQTLSPNKPNQDFYLVRPNLFLSIWYVPCKPCILSCIKISTISKQTELSSHLSPFTLEYQQLCQKWFLRLWCIRCKLGIYLALKLTLSPNRPKRDSMTHVI